MILTIEVIENSEFIKGTIALVFSEHGTGIVGATGDDARLATQAALTAYWKVQDAQAQAREAQTGIGTSGTAPYITVTQAGIRALLQKASKAQPDRQRVLIDYVAADGAASTRVVVPTYVGDTLVACYDEKSDDARTFRIDRIRRAESA